MPACLSAAAMPIPPNPAPATTTRYDDYSGMDPPSRLALPGPRSCPGRRSPSRTQHGQDSGKGKFRRRSCFRLTLGPDRRTALLAMVGLADTPRLAVFVAERCGILVHLTGQPKQ